MSFWQRRYPSRRSSPRAAYFPVVESEAPNRIGCSAGAGAAIPVTTATTASHRTSRDILMVQPPLRAALRARTADARFPPRTCCAGKADARTAFLTYAFSDRLLGAGAQESLRCGGELLDRGLEDRIALGSADHPHDLHLRVVRGGQPQEEGGRSSHPGLLPLDQRCPDLRRVFSAREALLEFPRVQPERLGMLG